MRLCVCSARECVGCILHDNGAPGGGGGPGRGERWGLVSGHCWLLPSCGGRGIMIHPARAQSTSPAVLLLKISRSLKTMTCSPELPGKGVATADLCWKCRRIAHHYYPFHCDTQLKAANKFYERNASGRRGDGIKIGPDLQYGAARD